MNDVWLFEESEDQKNSRDFEDLIKNISEAIHEYAEKTGILQEIQAEKGDPGNNADAEDTDAGQDENTETKPRHTHGVGIARC